MPSRYVKLLCADDDAMLATGGGANGAQVIELALPRVVDMYEFDRINEEIARITDDDSAGRWVLDLDGSQYVGSAMLGVLVNLRQRIRGGGGYLAICCLSDALASAMRTCSLYNLFFIAPTRHEAIRLVNSLR